MDGLPDPDEYDSFEAWLIDSTSGQEIDMETMDNIVEKVNQSGWAKQSE